MLNLKITGMTCGHCVQSVTTALKGVPGVKGAEVDLATGSAKVEGDADPEALLAAVAEEGYAAEVRP